MTPEAQRIAIAEVCGWTVHHGGRYVHPKTERFHNLIVDPLDDLNAMHEAEKVLTKMGERGDYVIQLGAVVDKAGWKDHNFMITNATAAQRAEAFLRTLGLWRDDISNPNMVAATTASN